MWSVVDPSDMAGRWRSVQGQSPGESGERQRGTLTIEDEGHATFRSSRLIVAMVGGRDRERFLIGCGH